MKLLLMGAGYVGTALLRQLQGLTPEVYITTTREDKVETLRPYGKDVLLLGANSDEKLKEWISFCDAMIVLVAPGSSRDYETTYLETAKKISSALNERKSPFHLIYTGSTSVCEGAHADWITEEMELDPPSANAKILLETEKIYLRSEADACILRLGGIYGPNRELTDRARRLSGKEMSGDGNEPTNHVHLDDIVGGILFCLTHRLTGIYHLVNDDHPTRKELYSALCESVQVPSPIWSSKGQSGYRVSNRKIKEAGYIFQHPRLGR
ncbi:MAG: NAD-dependent epimerase/dehydratase family protein [Verrucomicrobia bacterium]|nr:NAD-dependent epimerase/dehydratase family protein [Verrucomicrobiota bacterium]